MSSKPEGYRYVNQYDVRGETRWACWVVQGGRARRAGTLLDYRNVRRWLRSEPYLIWPEIKAAIEAP